MNFDAPAVFVHSTAYKPLEAHAEGWDEVEWRYEPVPFYGTFWNENQQLLMFCVALGTDTKNRLWVADDTDEPITWFEVTGLRHE